jgi:uncharacterized lipoprotein YddW (UPF0748 family)
MLETLNEVLGPVKRWRIGGSVSRVARARRWWTTLLALVLTGLSVAGAVPPAEAQLFGSATPFEDNGPAPEFRGLWVDAYRDGFKTPEQVDRLLADARRANVNALLVQVRRRGDAFYARSLEPRTEDPSLAAGFDPLAYLIERAHNDEARVEVHAWVTTTTIWGSETRAPSDPRHAFNQHGPGAVGRDDWLSRREDGATWSRGYFVDPGHPDAASYTTNVVLNLVREYDIDGLHLDYIRYPERAEGLSWGYNETSIAQFNARHGRTGRPPGDDPLWSQWRRDQVTSLVRGIYLGALAIKPQVKISAAVIPWGDGPRTDVDWQRTAAYTSVFQDWRGWLEEGIVDQVMPMNYFRDSAGSQAAWFDRWVAWQRDHAYGRQVIPGVALYLNDPAASLSQIRRALAAGPDDARTAGVALYSYAATRADTPDDTATARALSAEVWSALAEPGPANGGQPPFAGRTSPPGVAWKSGGTSGQMIPQTPGLEAPRVERP